MIKTLTRYVAGLVLRNELAHQKKVGYKLVFHDLPPDWIQGYAMVDLTFTWRVYGLPIQGLNYFTVGAIKNGVTTRYQEKSDLYQAWLGGYVFQSKKPLTWHADRYVRLAEADQKGWLRQFGAEDPRMDFSKLKKVQDMEIAGKKATLFAWSGVTKSDVGPSSHSILTQVMMDGMADMMNALTPGLKVKGENFIPPPSHRLPYEELLISGYTILINIDSRTKAVLYVCMVGDNQPDRAVMKRLITQNVNLVEVK